MAVNIDVYTLTHGKRVAAYNSVHVLTCIFVNTTSSNNLSTIYGSLSCWFHGVISVPNKSI